MRHGRRILAAALLLAGGVMQLSAARPGASTRPASTQPASTRPAGAASAIDPARVAELVRQMASPRYRTREAASEALRAMGPDVLPLLVQYANHADPEVATRVREVLGSYAYLQTGVIVTRVMPASQAERLGVRVGDVFVRVDDLDITDLNTLREVNYNQPRVYITRREDALVRLRAGPGLLGAFCSGWSTREGGPDHAAGLVLLARREYAPAYRRLQAAYAAGMRDAWTLLRLAGLADYHLDHKQAVQFRGLALSASPFLNPEWARIDIDGRNFGLPMSSAHTDYLLGRMRGEPFAADLYYRLDTYFLGTGRNLPLARQTAARRWPKGMSSNLAEPVAHTNARLRIALHDRRWADALDEHRTGEVDAASHPLALLAAVAAADPYQACKIAVQLDKAYRLSPFEEVSNTPLRETVAGVPPSLPERQAHEQAKLDRAAHLLYAWSAAVAAEEVDLAGEIMDRLVRLREHWPVLLSHPAAQACEHAALAPALARALEPHLSGSTPEPVRKRYLDFLFYDPKLTPQQWDNAWRAHSRGRFQAEHYRRLNALALTRLGQFARARQAVQADKVQDAALNRALDFLAPRAARLAGDYTPLMGVFHLYPGHEKDTHWAVRYDGAVWHVDAAGKLHHYPGLASGQPQQVRFGDRIAAFPTGTVCLRRRGAYLFDDKLGRWRQAYHTPGLLPAPADWVGPETPDLLRYLLKTFPGEGRELTCLGRHAGPGTWRLHRFSDEITLAVRRDTRQIFDLPLALAERLKRTARVKVYRPRRVSDRLALIPTDAGLWSLAADGQLARLALPLPDQNVMTVLMAWPLNPGKAYIGVAPQQGGQVVEMDLATGRLRLTEGYNGQGPDDAFAARGDFTELHPCDAGLQEIHRRRLSRRPATPPEKPL